MWERDFKLARARERQTRDLNSVRCIKDENSRVLIEDTKSQESWQSYFYKFFNGKRFDVFQHTTQLAQEEQPNFRPCHLITKKVGMAMGRVELYPHPYPFSKITPIPIPIPIRYWKLPPYPYPSGFAGFIRYYRN